MHGGRAKARVSCTDWEEEKGLRGAGASLCLRWNPIVYPFVLRFEAGRRSKAAVIGTLLWLEVSRRLQNGSSDSAV